MPEFTPNPVLEYLSLLVGEWEIEATHRLLSGTLRGSATGESLGANAFLIWRTHYEHPEMPDAINILGCDETGDLRNPNGGCSMHYFDVRGITRLHSLDAEPGVWKFWRDAPGFAQRFTGTISPDGSAIAGVVELCTDGSTWQEDLTVTYRRVR